MAPDLLGVALEQIALARIREERDQVVEATRQMLWRALWWSRHDALTSSRRTGGLAMDQLHTRLDALEQQVHTLRQQTHTVNRRLHWWRSLACGVVALAVLTWALPAVIAQEEDAKGKGPKGLAQRVAALEDLLKHFSREKDEIFITGANLHLVNGLGSTDCTDEGG
jgi:hypothetical protein